MAIDDDFDLVINDDGDIGTVDPARGLDEALEAYRQDLAVRMHVFSGEWFLDEDVGLPYYQTILIKNPQAAAIQAVFREALLEAPYVKEITSLDLSYDGQLRKLTVKWRVQTDAGDLPGSVETA
jgi:hypothetical protein